MTVQFPGPDDLTPDWIRQDHYLLMKQSIA